MVNLLKKSICLILILIFLLTPIVSFAENLEIFGEGAILMDADTSQVIYEKNAHKKLFPASTTKIMTGILAIELGNLDDIVTIDNEIVQLTDGSHIALEPGEQLTLEELLNALLIESANDSALAIAKHISGSIDVFINLMNEKAKEIGAKNTYFVNPNGLHHDEHYSTAYDLALMGQYAMKNDTFKNIVKNYTYTIPITNKKNEPRFLKSANRLIYSTSKINIDGNAVPIKYEGATGIKTGYTKKAQSCLVSSVNKDNRNLISVVLKSNGENLFLDTHKLFNFGFDNFRNEKLGFSNQFIGNFNVNRGASPIVSGILKDDISYSLNLDKLDAIESKINTLEDIQAPIKQGDILGYIEYILDDTVIAKGDIISTANIDIDPDSILYKKILNKWYLFVFLILFLLRLNKYLRIRKIRKFKSRNKRY